MIRFKIVITFRDDTTRSFDARNFPQFLADHIEIEKDEDNYEYIPKEAVSRIKVKRYWKQK